MKRIGRLVGIVVLMMAALTIAACSSSAVDISNSALLDKINAGTAPLILDVRSRKEFASSHVPGAINIPHTEVKSRLAELGDDKGREIVVYCESGMRAGKAESVLASAGFSNLLHLDGDMAGWRRAQLPAER